MAKDETVKPARNVVRDTCTRCKWPEQVLGSIAKKICMACMHWHAYHERREHFGDPDYWIGQRMISERRISRITYTRADTAKPRDLLGGR